MELPAEPSSAGRARRAVADDLGRRGCVPDVVDDAVLLTSELVANAVRHAGTDLWVRVVTSRASVRVEVGDASPRLPVPPGAACPVGESGRGLELVARVAARWGAERHGQGKVVWFELAPGANR